MKYLIVDDHPLIREALGGVLASLRPEAHGFDAANAREALVICERESDVDLVLLDLHLPDVTGLGLLETLRRQFPATAVVMISANDDPAAIQAALAAGASGFIPKAERREVLMRALELVLAGGVYVPTGAIGSGLTGMRQAPSDSLRLTDRQAQVLTLMMQGRNNKLIGRALGLAEPTVKNHVSAILRALDVGSRTEAVLKASALGWRLPHQTLFRTEKRRGDDWPAD